MGGSFLKTKSVILVKLNAEGQRRGKSRVNKGDNRRQFGVSESSRELGEHICTSQTQMMEPTEFLKETRICRGPDKPWRTASRAFPCVRGIGDMKRGGVPNTLV
jgi:hypothetical protein